jgi:hypothetical protein
MGFDEPQSCIYKENRANDWLVWLMLDTFATNAIAMWKKPIFYFESGLFGLSKQLNRIFYSNLYFKSAIKSSISSTQSQTN